MSDRSKLVKMRIVNIGCIGPEGLTVELDNILCLVGANNTGKSTVLRAYELAVSGTDMFNKEIDLCKRANDESAIIELWVHIPEGTANIPEKWKIKENGLLLVKSKWEWNSTNNWKRIRLTWDPEIDNYSNEKASGLDTVFSSRLPKPFRIGTLEEPESEHNKLLTLILQPIADKLKEIMSNEDSELKQALSTINNIAQTPVNEEKQKLDEIKIDINRHHNEIFPDLKVDFEIGFGSLEIDFAKLLLNHSFIKFLEWADEIDWKQQGTGSQRALFWTMLQVRSRLNALSDLALQSKKDILEREKRIQNLKKGIESAKKEETKEKKINEIEILEEEIKQFKLKDPETILKEQITELSLPGYMLLIDEPEVALHPGAVRAACKYLYNLAEDPSWQVMISTHSPLFIDPLQDHTTIVRLDRSKIYPSPKTYRSDSVKFSDDEKTNLKMLNRFDQGLSEMFFGQYPILIEGDTEFAAFETIMNSESDKFPAYNKPVLVRARGKWTLSLIIRMLSHFNVSFSILHDIDSPKTKNGDVNNAWSANFEIYKEIKKAREKGIKVIHRISLPNFELNHLSIEVDRTGFIKDTASKEKPWNIFKSINESEEIKNTVKQIFYELLNNEGIEEPFEKDYKKGLMDAVKKWAEDNAPEDNRYKLD